jgi:carbamoyltransferase
MEFGPRALGGSSIIGDPRSPKMQSVMNLKIKYRESFRPFAPSVFCRSACQRFSISTTPARTCCWSRRSERTPKSHDRRTRKLFGIERLNIPRSNIPAVTHVDYSARIQTVHKETNPRFHRAVLRCSMSAPAARYWSIPRSTCEVNRSWASPEDAYRCFMRTEMDYLVLENVLLSKTDQPSWKQDDSWKTEFELD